MFVEEVPEEEWKNEFGKIDKQNERDGWISFLEFARYASVRLKSPEKYLAEAIRYLEGKEEEESMHKKKLVRSKSRKGKLTRSNSSYKKLNVEPQDDDFEIEETVKVQAQPLHRKNTSAKPTSLMKQFIEKMNREEAARRENRKVSLFKVSERRDSSSLGDPSQYSEGSAEYLAAKLQAGRRTVCSNRRTAFLNRLSRDEKQVQQEATAAEQMVVSTELSQELIAQRQQNDKIYQRNIVRGNQKQEKEKEKLIKKKDNKRKQSPERVIGPFSFAEIPIHHVKPNSYAAECERKRIEELEALGKPRNQSENGYVDNRPFSINNLNRIFKILHERALENSDDDETPSQPFVRIETASDRSSCVSSDKKVKDMDESKAKFRIKIEQRIEDGRTSSSGQKRVRPKSASSSINKTSMENFDNWNGSSGVQEFFNSFSDAHIIQGQRPKSSLYEKYAVNKSTSLILSSQGTKESKHKSNVVNIHTNANQSRQVYISDLDKEPHLMRGKKYIDRGDHDRRRYGNERFDDTAVLSRPRSGHFPSKYDTLSGSPNYELWDSKRDERLRNRFSSPIKSADHRKH